MRLIALAAGLLALAGCSDPAEKPPGTNNDTTVVCPNGPPACNPDDVENDCEPGRYGCYEVGEPGCSRRCVSPNLCINNAPPPECEIGRVEVQPCPPDETCTTVSSCGQSIECGRLRSIEDWSGASPCQVDEDCVLVPQGDVCGCLECPAGATHTSRVADFEALLDAARALCPELTQCGDAPCVLHVPHCDLTTNRCTAREARYVTTEGAPKDCTVAEDCAAVFAGEVCDACQCPNDAVRADFVATYQSAFDLECAHGVDCDCAAPTVTCDAGTCAIVP